MGNRWDRHPRFKLHVRRDAKVHIVLVPDTIDRNNENLKFRFSASTEYFLEDRPAYEVDNVILYDYAGSPALDLGRRSFPRFVLYKGDVFNLDYDIRLVPPQGLDISKMTIDEIFDYHRMMLNKGF